MRIGVIPENFIEHIVLRLGVVPTPLMDTMMAMLLARTIMVGTKIGVFESLAKGSLTANELALRCQIHPEPALKLINALVSAGYLHLRGDQYSLAPVARKWLLQDKTESLYDSMLFRFMEWDFVSHYETYLRSGQSLDVHETLSTKDEWGLYQRGMRSLAGTSALEVARRTPVPKAGRDMLDIGGSHGYYSVALCRRYPQLHSIILDLPQAIEQAAPILAKEKMGERVVHRAGDALTDDLGSETFDLIFIAQVVHHFDDAANRALAKRIARALRPGGMYVIQEVIRPSPAKAAGQTGALMDLYFALTSQAGAWSFEQMADWQRQAGLIPQKPIRFRSVPGVGQQAAMKPAL